MRTFALAAAALLSTACVQDPGPQVTACGDLATFAPVSNVLEKRCGTLDCHGNLARPFRLYGKGGLRLATAEELQDPEVAKVNGTVSGGNGTTTGEFELNWRSLCGLEPEKMTAVQAGKPCPNEKDDGPCEPQDLLIMRKPLGPEIDGGERHKGGQLFLKGGPGYTCLESWILDDLVLADCSEASSDL